MSSTVTPVPLGTYGVWLGETTVTAAIAQGIEDHGYGALRLGSANASTGSEIVWVAEAATYVRRLRPGLRRWDRDGTLPAVHRPGSKHRDYRQADLEPFRLEYRRAEAASGEVSVLTTANADIEANLFLREPQKEAHRAVRSTSPGRTIRDPADPGRLWQDRHHGDAALRDRRRPRPGHHTEPDHP
jgi:hypothetical protein